MENPDCTCAVLYLPIVNIFFLLVWVNKNSITLGMGGSPNKTKVETSTEGVSFERPLCSHLKAT